MDSFFERLLMRLFRFALFVLFTVITGGLYLLYFWSTRTEEMRRIQVDILKELREMNGTDVSSTTILDTGSTKGKDSFKYDGGTANFSRR